ELTLSDASAPELGVSFDDTCGYRHGASAPSPCRDPLGIVSSTFTLDGPPSDRYQGYEPNGAVKAIKVDGDFRATIVAHGVAEKGGQLLAFGVRRASRLDIWVRMAKSFWSEP